MLSIAVCEDHMAECCRLSLKIRDLLEEKKVSCSLRQFYSGKALLEADGKFDLIFLDILMDGMDGMETAGRLRERGGRSLLVFVSSSRDYVFDAYDVEAYLVKPVDERKLRRVLLRALTKMEHSSGEFLIVNKGRERRKLFLDDVFYFEIRGRVIEAHGMEGVFSYYGQIGFLENSLREKGFFRCHKSYLVNLKHVDSYGRQELLLDNGERLGIAKRRQEEFGREILQFMKREGGIL